MLVCLCFWFTFSSPFSQGHRSWSQQRLHWRLSRNFFGVWEEDRVWMLRSTFRYCPFFSLTTNYVTFVGWKHGARVLEITQNKFGAETWLRLEDGSVEIQKKHDGIVFFFSPCVFFFFSISVFSFFFANFFSFFFPPFFWLFETVAWRKYIGCCHMEGHKIMAMTWLNLLVLLLYVIVFAIIFYCALRAFLRFYCKRGGKTRHSLLDRDEYEKGNTNWEIKNLTQFWWSKAPRARQRRVNELDSVWGYKYKYCKTLA